MSQLFISNKRRTQGAAGFSSQSGQVGIVILLMMAVILTVGLSVVARTTQDVSLSNQNSDSARIFNEAENVLDQTTYDLQQSFGGGPFPVGKTITANDTQVTSSIVQSSTVDNRIFQGESVMVNLVAGVSSIRLDWSKAAFDADCSTSPQQPASLLVFIYSAGATKTNIRTQAIAGCNRSDGFTAGTAQGGTYRFKTTIALKAGDLFVRIKPVYADTYLRVTGVGLPTEQYTITSAAQNTTGNETRKIQLDETLPTAPAVMDYVLYSGQDLVK